MLSCVFFFKQKTAYELRISDWSSDVCSSDLYLRCLNGQAVLQPFGQKIVLLCHRIKRLPDRGSKLQSLDHFDAFDRAGLLDKRFEIGRASCRERVRQYV